MDRYFLFKSAPAATSVLAIALATIILTSPVHSVAETVQLRPRLSPFLAEEPEHKPAQARSGDTQSHSVNRLQLVYSAWTKSCLKVAEPNVQEVCYIGKNAHLESGMPVVAAVLIEPANGTKKILRVTLPLGMQLTQGTRITVDNGWPMTAPYITCANYGCLADYELSLELISELKRGANLIIQGINTQKEVVSLALPLSDFGKTYDAAPAAPKMSEQEQKNPSAAVHAPADDVGQQARMPAGANFAPGIKDNDGSAQVDEPDAVGNLGQAGRQYHR